MSNFEIPDLKTMKRILVIKLRHLGDLLLATPVFETLKKAVPQAEIDAYIYKEASEILEGNPAISNFIIYDRIKRGLKNELAVWWQIKKRNYDLVINLTEGDRGTIATFVSRAPYRVGLYPNGFQTKFYNCCVRRTHNNRHIVERNLDALRCLGIFPRDEDKKLTFYIAPEIIKEVQDNLKKQGMEKGQYIVIHPASRWAFKWWPIEKMQQLTTALMKRGAKLVFTSSNDPIEMQMVEKIIGSSEGKNVLNYAGKTSQKELGALIAGAQAVICLDSFALHLASTFRVPTVVLFGATSEHTWGPWQNTKARVAATDISCRPCNLDGCGGSKVSDCLLSLSVDKVLNLLDEVLAKNSV